MTSGSSPGDDASPATRARSIRVTEPSPHSDQESTGRRTGGIDTVSSGINAVSTGFDTVTSLGTVSTGIDSRLTAGLSAVGGSFTGLLGLGLVRHDSPVTLTFRQARVDADADTPLDSPSDGSSHTAVTADDDRSAVVTSPERPALVADTAASTVRHQIRRRPQTVGARQPMARLQRSAASPEQSIVRPRESEARSRPSTTSPQQPTAQPRQSPSRQSTISDTTADISRRTGRPVPSRTLQKAARHALRRSADTFPSTRSISRKGHTQRAMSQRQSRITVAEPASGSPSAAARTRTPTSITDSAWPLVVANSGSVIAGRSLDSRHTGESRYSSGDRRHRAVQPGKPADDVLASTLIEPKANAPGTDVDIDSFRTGVAVDSLNTGVDDGPSDVGGVPRCSPRGTGSRSLAAATAGSNHLTTTAVPLQRNFSRVVSAGASSDRQSNVGRRSTDSRRQPATITPPSNALDRGRTTQAVEESMTATVDGLSLIRTVGSRGSVQTPTRSADGRQQPVNASRIRPEETGSPPTPRHRPTDRARQFNAVLTPLGRRRSTGVSDRPPTITVNATPTTGSHEYAPRPSTGSIDQLAATAVPGALPHPLDRGRSRQYHSSAGWYRSPTPVVSTRAVDPTNVANRDDSSGQITRSGTRQFRSERVFATVDGTAVSDRERPTATATGPHDHRRQLSKAARQRSEGPGVSSRISAASQLHRSRESSRVAVFSSALRTVVTRGSAGGPTTTTVASRFGPRSGRSLALRDRRRSRAGSVTTSRVGPLHDSSTTSVQQSQQLPGLQPSARSRFTETTRPEPTSHQRRPLPVPSDLEADRRPRRDPSSTGPLGPSSQTAGTRAGGSAQAAGQPTIVSFSRLKRPRRQHDTAPSQPPLAATRPTVAAAGRSPFAPDTDRTVDPPAATALDTADASSAFPRPRLTHRFSSQSSPIPSRSVPSTTRPRSGLSASIDRTDLSRTVTESSIGSTTSPEAVLRPMANRNSVASSRGVSSSVADRLEPTTGLPRPSATGPLSATGPDGLDIGSEQPTPTVRSLRQPPAVARHGLATARTDADAEPTAGASGSTANQSVASRPQSVLDRGWTTDRIETHRLLSAVGRRPLTARSEQSVPTAHATSSRTALTPGAATVSSDAPAGLATTIRQTVPNGRTDVVRSRQSTRRRVAGRSTTSDTRATTLSWPLRVSDRPIQRSRQSAAARGGSEPASRLSDQTGGRPLQAAGGSRRGAGAYDLSSRRRQQRHSADQSRSDVSPNSVRSSASTSVSPHTEPPRSDADLAAGAFSPLGQPFNRPTDTASDPSSPRQARSWSHLGPGVSDATRAVTRPGNSYPGMTVGSTALSRSDSDSRSITPTVSTLTLVDREPVGTGPVGTGNDASMLSLAADLPTDAEPTDSGRRPGSATDPPSHLDAGRQPRPTRSRSLTHATGTLSATLTGSSRSNTDQKRVPTAESGDRNGRPQLTFKKPRGQRGSEAAHEVAEGRVGSNHRHQRKRSAESDAAATGREVSQPRSAHQDRATTQSGPFDPVDRPDRQSDPTTDRTSPGRSSDARQDVDRQPRGGGFDDPINGASLAYNADVDRVVETLYRRLERKLRIERERTGF